MVEKMAGLKTNKTTRKCSECIYRKWYGDYSLYICEISGKVIEPYYYCDIPNDIFCEYIRDYYPTIIKKEN